MSPGAATGNGITRYAGRGGVYGHTLVHSDLNGFALRSGFACAIDPRTVVRGGFGTSHVHYARAGSGDILTINAPQPSFVSATQGIKTTPQPTAAGICPPGAPATTCYVTSDQGCPATLPTTLNPATDTITYVPANTRDGISRATS